MASKSGVTVVITGKDESGAVLNAVKAHLAEVSSRATEMGVAERRSGEEASKGFLNARASIGLLDNTIRGAHAQAMADLVREFSNTGIVMAALPLAAATGGIVLIGGIILELVEKIKEWREEQSKLASDLMQFDTSVQNVFNGLDRKLLEAGIHADELRGDHLAALQKQLKLIDMQSMSDLITAFGSVEKAADLAFADIQSHWYTFGSGAAGAQNALTAFQAQYASLLAKQDSKGASDLLAGTLASAQKKLADLQKALAASRASMPHAMDSQDAVADIVGAGKRAHQAALQKDIDAQNILLKALNDQVEVEKKIKAAADQNGKNATNKVYEDAAKKREKEIADFRKRSEELTKASNEQDQRQVDQQNRMSQELGRFIVEQDSKKSAAAAQGLKRQTDVLRAEQEERIRAATEQMQLAERTAEFEVQMGRMSASERVEYLRRALNTELSIKQDAERKLAGIDAAGGTDPARVQRDLDAVREAQQRHDDQMQALAMEDAERRKGIADGLLHSILDPLMERPKSIADAFKRMADSILSDLTRISEHRAIEGIEGYFDPGHMGGGIAGVRGFGGLGGIFGKLFHPGGKASNGGLATGAGTIADSAVSALQQGRGGAGASSVVVNILNQGTPQQVSSSGSSGGNGLEHQIITIVMKDADTLGPMSKALGGAISMIGKI